MKKNITEQDERGEHFVNCTEEISREFDGNRMSSDCEKRLGDRYRNYFVVIKKLK